MFLDVVLGIIWATLTSVAFLRPLDPAWLAAGILFALLPDIDFWTEFVRRRGKVGGKVLDQHRVLTHLPLVFIPLTMAMYIWAGPEWGTLFFLGVYGHFVHDLMGMGYGYRLLYPLSTRYFKFFSDPNGHVSYSWKHFLATWTDAEVRRLHQLHGNDNWLAEDVRYHLRHWPILLWQLVVLILFLIMVKFFFYV